LFLDASGLFAGIWSETGGGRAILKLGEARAIQIVTSPEVLQEVDSAFREKSPELLAKLTLLIDAANLELTGSAAPAFRKKAKELITYPPDAEILAAAISANVDYFVTLDKKHFLSNKKLKNSLLFETGTPGDFLAWYRLRFTESD